MHSAPVQPHAFSIAGVATTDYAKVQAHIAEIETSNAALELAMKETTDSNRKAFASSLAENNKILASQIPSVEALVLTMTPEQFDAYRATYEAAPSIGAFGSHGQESGGAPANPASGEGSGPTSLELAEAVVTRLRRSGMTEEQVVKTSAYAAMQSLQAAQAQS